MFAKVFFAFAIAAQCVDAQLGGGGSSFIFIGSGEDLVCIFILLFIIAVCFALYMLLDQCGYIKHPMTSVVWLKGGTPRYTEVIPVNGRWTGSYIGTQLNSPWSPNFGTHPMVADIQFHDGIVKCALGSDENGAFLLCGDYDSRTGRIAFVKSYTCRVNDPIQYWGTFAAESSSMSGEWRLPTGGEKGTFILSLVKNHATTTQTQQTI